MKLTETQLDDAIDLWHDGNGQGMELHTYLGWTDAEYAKWCHVDSGGVIPESRDDAFCWKDMAIK